MSGGYYSSEEVDLILGAITKKYEDGDLDEHEVKEKFNVDIFTDLQILDPTEKRRQMVYELVFNRRWSYRKASKHLKVSPRTIVLDVKHLREEIKEVGKKSKQDFLAEIVNRNEHRYQMLLETYKAAGNKTTARIQAIEAMRREDEFLVDTLGIKEMNAEMNALLDVIRASVARRAVVKDSWQPKVIKEIIEVNENGDVIDKDNEPIIK